MVHKKSMSMMSLLLAIVMCMSLVACSGSVKTNENLSAQETEPTDQTVETSQETVDAEAEEDTTADSAVTATEVTITKDNWQDYFELKLIESNRTDKTFYSVFFVLKDEYAQGFDSAVTCELPEDADADYPFGLAFDSALIELSEDPGSVSGAWICKTTDNSELTGELLLNGGNFVYYKASLI